MDLSSLTKFPAKKSSGGREVLTVKVEEVEPDTTQPRKTFDVDGLAADIKARGIVQPIIVAPKNISGKYKIINGGRRYAAAMKAGLETVPVLVETTENRSDSFAQVLENTQRADLRPDEVADFIKRMVDSGIGKSDIARRLNETPSYVTKHLALHDACDELKEAWRSGRFHSLTAFYEAHSFLTNKKRTDDEKNGLLKLVATESAITKERINTFTESPAAVAKAQIGEAPQPTPEQPSQTTARDDLAPSPSHAQSDKVQELPAIAAGTYDATEDDSQEDVGDEVETVEIKETKESQPLVEKLQKALRDTTSSDTQFSTVVRCRLKTTKEECILLLEPCKREFKVIKRDGVTMLVLGEEIELVEITNKHE